MCATLLGIVFYARHPMIIDAHLDLAFNALALDNNLDLSLAALRAVERPHATCCGVPTVTLPALRAADVRVVFGTVFVQSPQFGFDMCGPIYTTPEQARAQGWAQIQFYRQLAERGAITLVTDQAALDAVISTASTAPGLVPLMEGADPIRDPDDVAAWYAAGIRIVGLAWGATRYSGGTFAPGPLTPAGRALLPALRAHRIALDASHLAEASFWEALDLFDGPVIASHSNCRTFIPTDRHLTDDMLRAIVERNGVIGVVLYNKFLAPDWQPGDPKSAVTLDAVVRQIEHICEIAGDTNHVGIGSDLDGGFGRDDIPAELDSCLDLGRIGAALCAAGWRDNEIAGVLGGNWARWLRFALPG
jgi:membrane dipeptidase